MKLVFTAAEVATALQLDESDFVSRLPILEAHGFPAPIEGLADRWSIIDVVNWINREKAAKSSRLDGMAESPAVNPSAGSNVTPFRNLRLV